MAALVLLGNTDGFFDLSFLQATGNSWSKLAGLLTGLAESNVSINHDADRPRGHDCQDDDNAFGRKSHIRPHGTQVKSDLVSLQEHHRKKVKLSEKHRLRILLNLLIQAHNLISNFQIFLRSSLTGRTQNSQ